MTFSGTAGQFASLGINSTTLSGFNNSLSVNKPDGTTLVSTGNFSLSTNFHMTLPVTGTYAIIVDPVATVTGNITLSLSSEVDAGTIVVDGASVTAAITRVGQRARMTFSGAAGQFASLGVNSTTIHFNSDLIVNKPDGSTLVSDGSLTIDTNFHMTLPATGTYVILIDAEGTSIGNLTLTLSSELNAGMVEINGSAVSLSINRIGQRARVTFSGNSGQQATVRITNNTISNANVRLFRPDGSQLTSSTSSASSFNLATQTLPTTGTYSILVDPGFTNTGSMSVSVTSP